MKVKIKKLNEDAVIPKYSKSGDAGLDLTAISKIYDEFGNVEYDTGLAFEIPENYVGLIFPRSSNCKKDLLLSNSVGVIDSNYRGSVKIKFKPSVILTEEGVADIGTSGIISNKFDAIAFPDDEYGFEEYEAGDRIAQLIIIPYPQIEFEEVTELSETERNDAGFGSSGK